MNASAFIKVDKAAFYAFIASEPEGRFEFVRGRIMQQQQGGTKRHGSISGRIAEICRRQLDRMRWIVIEGRGVDTPETVRFGDVVVEPVDEPDDSLATKRPALVVEVLSPSSSDRDLDVKPAEYLSLDSLEAYIVASQEEPACYLWVRGPDRHFPRDPVSIRGADKLIDIPALSLSISLSEVYR
jgi:Uma2 family endonuclease